MMKHSLLALLAALLVSGGAFAQDTTDSMLAVTSKLLCPCGCSNMLLSSCICETSQALHREIQQEIDSGKSAEVITAGLVAQYGPQMWAAPPAKGFNLTAWIAPGVITLLLLGVFVWIIRAKLTPHPEEATPPKIDPSDEYAQRIEEDLKQLRRD